MKAIQIDSYGGPDVLRWRDVKVDRPGPRQALVRLAYSGINFMDIHTRDGKYASSRNYTTTLPLTLGVEGSGWIEGVGSEVDDWREGDRVAYCIVRGSYAEYALVPVDRLVAVPPAIPLKLAAAALFQGMTAHYLVHDVGHLQPGMTCLVHSGSGGIGQVLIQMAKQRGAYVAATASTGEKAQVAKQRGADDVFLYHEDGLAQALKRSSLGFGFDVVLDSVGRDTFSLNLNVLRRQGLFILYGSNSGPVRGIDPMELADAGSLFFTRPRLADYIREAAALKERARQVFEALSSGTLGINITNTYGMETVSRAHADLERRCSIGKSVLEVCAE